MTLQFSDIIAQSINFLLFRVRSYCLLCCFKFFIALVDSFLLNGYFLLESSENLIFNTRKVTGFGQSKFVLIFAAFQNNLHLVACAEKISSKTMIALQKQLETAISADSDTARHTIHMRLDMACCIIKRAVCLCLD